MKQIIGAVFSLFLSTLVSAQDYKPTDPGSTIEFVIKNFGMNSRGTFSGLDGRISFDPKDNSKAVFDVSIAAATINTDNEMRDGHLKKDAYFDAEKYPRIRMVSTSISGPDGGRYTFNGKLTIKDKTQDLSFPFVATPMGEDYLFKGSFTINRRDFGVGGSSTLSNNCIVNLSVLAKKQ
ncbi:YceI family protein [Puia sp.]|jgi:polyisoprenoid-binding protein YceI|uniref:YceI family protein n=1 Tax=Puia sp. TaxID=2045100 RepID=UPI002F3E2921